MDTTIYYLIPLFFIIAFIYSSVGLGGGSSYLAVMAIFDLSSLMMPKIVLVCNLIVVIGGTFIFYKKGHLSIKKALPFVLGSIPLAYIGGLISINKDTFLLILAITLFLSVFWILVFPDKSGEKKSRVDTLSAYYRWTIGLGIGCILGFLSGLVGVGGGVFLVPVLYVINWGNPKEIAALASFFILANSISGLMGQFTKSSLLDEYMVLVPLGLAVLVGGQLGSRLGARVFKEQFVKRLTAILVLFVSLRIYYKLLNISDLL